MKKKFLTILMICALICTCLFVFAACGDDSEATDESQNQEEHDHDHDHEEEGEDATDPCGGNHTVVIDEAKPSTCTNSGLSEGKHCSVCNKTLLPQLLLQPLGHEYVDGVCTTCGKYLYSQGLAFTDSGKGTCYVSGIGSCTDTEISIPMVSPEGLVVRGIAKEAFMGCNTVTAVKFSKTVLYVEAYAFKNCSALTDIIFSDEVTSIGEEAFFGCDSITALTVGKGITSIGKGAFANCYKLESISVADGNETYCTVGNCLIETASKTLVLGCKNSTIPTDGSVTAIGYGAFWGNLALTAVTIPNTVTSIGDGAFIGCSALTSVVVPSSVTDIGQFAFWGCTALKSVTLPAGLKNLNTQLFFNCTALSTITFTGTTAQWEALSKGSSWNASVPAASVRCTNGSVSLK